MDDEERLTPREEFEEEFGQISDDQWQWLKEFTERNYDIRAWLQGVVGYRVLGRIYHPYAVEILRNSGVERPQARTDPDD